MGISDLGRYALGVWAAAMLAGCGGESGTPLSPSPAGPSTALRVTTAERTHVRPAYSVIYSFKGGTGDGRGPTAGLLNVNRTLYGTTANSGANNAGTVFSITPSGADYKELYSFFKDRRDGANPLAGLTYVNGTLYGTTEMGGSRYGSGTVFKMTKSGTETVLHRFGGSGDGQNPDAGLINVKGTLYGTTYYGGNGYGTVFSLTPSGKETVLYSFKGGKRDGAKPYTADLLDVSGTLYGTTSRGGARNKGTVFSITPSGVEKVLRIFRGYRDGRYPLAGLINVKGTLYGTTPQGGGSGCNGYGCGTVFSITTSGVETVLHSFNGTDGENPTAGLIDVNGTLYGTTSNGGSGSCSFGCGTVFAITTSGEETVLHSFTGKPDGADPEAGLLNVNGTLYGTTSEGGAHCGAFSGCGTVFSLSP